VSLWRNVDDCLLLSVAVVVVDDVVVDGVVVVFVDDVDVFGFANATLVNLIKLCVTIF
jgi:hypothetical protein